MTHIEDEMEVEFNNAAEMQWQEMEHEQYLQRKKKRAKLEAYEDILQSAEDIVRAVEDGWIGAAEAYAFFTGVVNYLTDCKKGIFNEALQDVGDDKQTYFGYEISTRSSAGRWKFTDAEYIAQKNKLKAMEEQRKSVYKLSKHGEESATIIDPDTGEIVPPAEWTDGKTTVVASKAPSQ